MRGSLLVITGHSRTPWAGLEPVDGAARGQTSRDGGDLGGSAQSAVRVRRNGPAAAAGAWSEAENGDGAVGRFRANLPPHMGRITRFSIEDELRESGRMAIEVVVSFDDGQRRLAHFATPDALKVFGDWVPGTKIRYHVGLIVIEQLTHELIEATLKHLDEHGELLLATRPLR